MGWAYLASAAVLGVLAAAALVRWANLTQHERDLRKPLKVGQVWTIPGFSSGLKIKDLRGNRVLVEVALETGRKLDLSYRKGQWDHMVREYRGYIQDGR